VSPQVQTGESQHKVRYEGRVSNPSLFFRPWCLEAGDPNLQNGGTARAGNRLCDKPPQLS